MSPEDAVASYYEAWISKRGDMSGGPLAADFKFRGPVANFDDADSYRAMAREAGEMVTSFRVRRQFTDGSTVCSIIDWEMALRVAPMTSAEILRWRTARSCADLRCAGAADGHDRRQLTTAS